MSHPVPVAAKAMAVAAKPVVAAAATARPAVGVAAIIKPAVAVAAATKPAGVPAGTHQCTPHATPQNMNGY